METTKTKHTVAIAFGQPPEFNDMTDCTAENTTTLVTGNGEIKLVLPGKLPLTLWSTLQILTTHQSAESKCQWSAQPQMGHLHH